LKVSKWTNSLIFSKMVPDEEHTRHCLLFCFHQKKSAAYRIIC